MDEIINNIEIMLSKKIEKDIPCCEDSTHNYDAYNNLDNMYNKNNVKYNDITIFNRYGVDISILATSLDVDYNLLEGLFDHKQIPSKGLTCAIAMVLKLDYNSTLEVLKELGYCFNSSDYDRIIEYFIYNNIYDINMLNEVLLHFGQMYLYSKRKLK
ncbi:MAG: hypothetical protein IKP77_01390 [Acholeplasmatales bacterium]|nr:hypothetical protein [Acholeplasmatales bacterium]